MSSLILGIYAHWRKLGAAASLKALLHELSSHDIEVLVEEQAAKLVGQQAIHWMNFTIEWTCSSRWGAMERSCVWFAICTAR